MTRLKGSGRAASILRSLPALLRTPHVRRHANISDSSRLNAKTSAHHLEYWAGIDQKISTVLLRFLGQSRASPLGDRAVLLRASSTPTSWPWTLKTGEVKWKTPSRSGENGYTITKRPDSTTTGIVYSGYLAAAEFATTLRAADRARRQRPARSCGGRTRSPGGERGPAQRPGRPHRSLDARRATIWNTAGPRSDLGLIYFVTGNCGRTTTARCAEGDNLFCASIDGPQAKTGSTSGTSSRCTTTYGTTTRPSPVVLFDTRDQRAAAQGHSPRRPHGLGVHPGPDERNAADSGSTRSRCPRTRGEDAKTQADPTRRRDRAAVASSCRATRRPAASSTPSGKPGAHAALGIGGTNWSPVPYSPDTGYFYCPARCARARSPARRQVHAGLRYTRGKPVGAIARRCTARHGDRRHDHKSPGSTRRRTASAGAAVVVRAPSCPRARQLLASTRRRARSCGGSRPASVLDGRARVLRGDGREQYVAIATGATSCRAAPTATRCGLLVEGQLGPMCRRRRRQTVAGPTGPIVEEPTRSRRCEQRGVQLFARARIRIKTGTT